MAVYPWAPAPTLRRRVRRVVAVVVAVAALTACGTSQPDLPSSSRTLDAPQDLSAQARGLSLTLSWDPVVGASSYVVYWKQGSTVTTRTGSPQTTPGTTFVHQAPTFGATYAYLVTAVDSGGREGRASRVITISPSSGAFVAPMNLRAIAGDRMVTLIWDPVPDATGYQISGTTPSGSFTLQDQTATSVTHRPIENRIEYRYQVRATFGTEVGPWSDPPVAAIPMPATPGNPVFIGVAVRLLPVTILGSPIGSPTGEVVLSWSAADHASDYQVYVHTEPDGLETPLINPANPLTLTGYVHTPVQFGVSYRYRVEAINNGVTSPSIDSALASVPHPLTSGAAYAYVVRAFDGSTESPDIPVASAEPADGTLTRTLSWTPTNGTGWTSQRLYRAPSSTDTYQLIATFGDLTTSNYTDQGVPLESVPTGVSVTAYPAGMAVSWSPAFDAPSGYRLSWWGLASDGTTATGSIPVMTTAYLHEGRQPGWTYTYAIQVEGHRAASPSVSAVAP